MTYVIAEPCVDVKDKSCIEECPVDCIYEGGRMLYIQPDDELFPAEYRGIGIRIEDDVVVTETGCLNLSEQIPHHPDEIEAWMASLR